MAKETANQPRAGRSGAVPAADAEVEPQMHDRDDAPREEDLEQPEEAGAAHGFAPRGEAAPGRRGERGGSFLDIYKRSQGTRVRLGTAAVAAVLLVWSAAFMHERLSVVENATTRTTLQALSGGVILLGGGLLTYYLLARRRGTVDFLIATEGEMKKVHWTTRKEVIGSTKVVILVVLFLAVAMFVVDIALMLFFSKIGVLRVGTDVMKGAFGGN